MPFKIPQNSESRKHYAMVLVDMLFFFSSTLDGSYVFSLSAERQMQLEAIFATNIKKEEMERALQTFLISFMSDEYTSNFGDPVVQYLIGRSLLYGGCIFGWVPAVFIVNVSEELGFAAEAKGTSRDGADVTPFNGDHHQVGPFAAQVDFDFVTDFGP